ncbi:DUF6531 domain-containing protein [Massilia sp. DJPM01]|uniref:DUF6531 domain-containing protein n=1 Tax=Massilia sp. DJPM01 TaxID=3024404 RepID=UPI00259F9F88|nr:DUF6531 domain-containing protein [Massilia sp. DJPM01]MDM5177191.1 DUF6531 domain-containing protein [Massilia sp. DJPM01]
MPFSLAGVFAFARFSSYRTLYALIAALFLGSPFNVHAEDYVGPYKYQGYNTVWYLTESAATASYMAAMSDFSMTPAVCGVGWYGVPTDWATDSSKAGIVYLQHRYYFVRRSFYGFEGRCDPPQSTTSGIGINRRRLVCAAAQGERYFMPAAECRSGAYKDQPNSNGSNVGPQCPSCNVGRPITPATGNMWHSITDYQPAKSASDLALSRIYNSAASLTDPYMIKGFGVRWSHSYNKSLKAEQPRSAEEQFRCWRFSSGEWDCTDRPDSIGLIPVQVSLVHSDGKRFTYRRDTSGAYTSLPNVDDKLAAVMSPDNLSVQEWTVYNAKGDRTERFDKSGLLFSITERTGLTQQLTYSDGVSNDTAVSRLPATAPKCANAHPGDVLPAGRLLCVTNHWGRQIQFKYDAKGRIIEMIDPALQSYLYEYDGPSGGCVPGNEKKLACTANNLTKVTYPDGKSQTYFYNEDSKINGGKLCENNWPPMGNGFGPEVFINLMTGLVDENEQRHNSWTYDCAGRATSSQLGDGIEKVTLAYTDGTDTSTTVTHYVGPAENVATTVRTYSKKTVQGIAKPTKIDAPCVECGSIAERAYDTIGNVTMTKDFNSNYSCFAYETSRSLETIRVEGASTNACTQLLSSQPLALPLRKTSTKWHAQLSLPEIIAEPKRITKYKYDASGNLITKTEQATTDLTGSQGSSAPVTGSIRTWTYTYNNVGQLQTVTGPRTDIVDLTKYDYDALTGYLVKVTNAAKQETTFSDYDGHGHVRTIRAPNGVTTTLSYTPRGWVASQAVSNGTTTQTTTYDYTPSGEVRTVTFPDNSVTTYTYDVAHRLTSVANNRGESIVYTLDLTGNRIKEEVRDPKGNLARQITRTYDTIGRLTSQTGAAQ